MVTGALVIPAAELRERFSRSSGPGGQGVNTADSRVELSFDVGASPSIPDSLRPAIIERLGRRVVHGVVTVAASEFRAQLANRRAARERLAALLRSAAKPPAPARRPTKPGRGVRERRLADKRRRSETKRGRQAVTD
ncbi:ribosome-associated protein [Actinocrispum wychmicini]|uniref:Ribosome-associated protein n=2 Tax=Actinocrispum wychmicini TaxID=1213861 RepID=A0A4R2JYM7_9PSEU|nr:ribosome-associated protein [Actinocrispum wychmicini]